MALPSNIDPASPLGTDQITAGDDQIRALKQFIADMLGIPVSPTSMTAAPFSITAAGEVTIPNSPGKGIGVTNYVVGGGTANAHTATFTPPFTSLVDGMEVSIRPIATNTAATTFKLDATIAKGIRISIDGVFTALVGNEIRGTVPATFKYEASNDVWVLLNPASIVTTTASNVFTADQTIDKASPLLKIKRAASGENALLQYVDETSTARWDVGMLATSGDFVISRSGIGIAAQFSLGSGKQTVGIVPLARMGTHFFASGATATTDLNIGSVSIGDIIAVSVRSSASVNAATTMKVFNTTGTGNTATFVFEPSAVHGTEVSSGVSHQMSSSGFMRVTGAGTAVIRSSLTVGVGTLTISLNRLGVIRYLNS